MRKFLVLLLCVVVFFMGAVASFTMSHARFMTPETPIDSSYLMQFTDNNQAYYLQKAAPDIIFYINSSSTDYTSLFTLTDYEGNEMSQRIKKSGKGEFKILPPENGYEKGKQYSLVLSENTFFTGNVLKEDKEFVFTIEKDEVASYTYNEGIKIISEEKLVVIDETTIDFKDIAIKKGDIFINETASEAYKILDILDDNTAIIEAPTLDEIYSDLQVYGDYVWNVDDIEWNEIVHSHVITGRCLP